MIRAAYTASSQTQSRLNVSISPDYECMEHKLILAFLVLRPAIAAEEVAAPRSGTQKGSLQLQMKEANNSDFCLLVSGVTV
jgi:hypothetical protein